jgi:hypothetical protein
MNKKTYFNFKRHLVTILLLYSFLQGNTQNCFKGKIIEKDTKTAISGAVISCDSLSVGSLSNDAGEYELKINAPHPLLRVSLIGYKAFEFRANNAKTETIALNESVISIGEVSVTNDDYATKLVRLANQSALHDTDQYRYSKGFYQRVMKRNDNIVIIHEFFFDAGITSYGIEQWNVTNARYAQVKDSNVGGCNNPTRIATFLSATLVKNFNNLNCNFPNTVDGCKKFTFTIVGFINKNDSDEIAIIACKPKKKVLPVFEGNMYIYTKNPRIARLKGNTQFLSFGIYALFIQMVCTLDISYIENANHVMSINNANYHFAMKYPISVFKRVRTSEDISLIIYQNNISKPPNLQSSFIKNDNDFIKTTNYDPQFWKDNTILKRQSIIQTTIDSFDKKNFFGNYGGN